MKRIYEISGTQTREKATLINNSTGMNQPDSLYFVQLDNEHAVDNTGAIFQISCYDLDELKEMEEREDYTPFLIYKGESGTVYNYNEDSADFEEDSEDLEIYSHCTQQAELLADQNL